MLFDFICVLMIFVVCCFAVSLVVVYLCWLVGFVCCVFVQGAMVPIGVLPGLRVAVFLDLGWAVLIVFWATALLAV